MQPVGKQGEGTWNEGRGDRAGTGKENRKKRVEKRPWGLAEKLSIYFDDAHGDDGEEAIYSECDIIRSPHLFNLGFSLARLGFTVAQGFSPPVIAWEAERQPGAGGERRRLGAAGYLEFLACLGVTTLLSSEGKLNLLIKFLLGDLSMYLFVESVDQESDSSSSQCICFCPLPHLRHIWIS